MKKILKYLVFIILGMLGFLLLYLLAAFLLSIITVNKNQSSSNEVTIYILTNGVHTDLVMPIENEIIDWKRHIKFEHTIAKDTTANLIAFGWGDKGFYLDTPTWAELKFSTAFKAAFGLSTCAIHTTFYQKMEEGETCKKIEISRKEYTKLTEYIKNGFLWDNNEVVSIPSDANYGDHDAFYEGVGSYSLFKTCNTWSNNALKAANQKACLWTPFDKGIFYQYSK